MKQKFIEAGRKIVYRDGIRFFHRTDLKQRASIRRTLAEISRFKQVRLNEIKIQLPFIMLPTLLNFMIFKKPGNLEGLEIDLCIVENDY